MPLRQEGKINGATSPGGLFQIRDGTFAKEMTHTIFSVGSQDWKYMKGVALKRETDGSQAWKYSSINNLVGISTRFPGKTGELMQMLQIIKSFYDANATCRDEMPYLIELLNNFINDPAQDTCYQACMSFYRLYGNLLGGVGYFKCHSICSKF